jgi:hypothetical protein
MEDFKQELVQGKVKEAMHAAQASSGDLWMVHPSRIYILKDFNVRVRNAAYEAKVEWLMDSIRANGFDRTKPIPGFIALEDGQHLTYAIGGHRRMEAVFRLIEEEGFEIDAIPMVLKPRGTTMEDLTVDLYMDNESDPNSLYEQSIIVKRMADFGRSEDYIAQRMGMTTTKVNDLLSLALAPTALRQLVAEEKVSATTAIATLKQHGEKALSKIETALDKAENGKVTPKQLATPEKVFQKAVKKKALVLHSTLSKVYSDPQFENLSKDIQDAIREVMADLDNQ